MAQKFHIPGPLVGRVQRCVRCHTRLDSNERWQNETPTGWRPGKPVVSDRYGMGTVSVEKAEGITPCGRKAQQEVR